MTDVRGTRAWRDMVTWAKRNLPWVCHLCGQAIPRHVHRFHELAYELDHKMTVRDHPELALHRGNVAPSHRRCNSWRKARPLTLGLLIECSARFSIQAPIALDFFTSSTESDQSQGGGRAKTTEPSGGPTTVIPSGISPRSLTVTDPTGSVGPPDRELQ